MLPQQHDIHASTFERRFLNVFNTLTWGKMLSAVLEFAPHSFSFVYPAYREPSFLFCDENILNSVEGVKGTNLVLCCFA